MRIPGNTLLAVHDLERTETPDLNVLVPVEGLSDLFKEAVDHRGDVFLVQVDIIARSDLGDGIGFRPLSSSVN